MNKTMIAIAILGSAVMGGTAYTAYAQATVVNPPIVGRRGPKMGHEKHPELHRALGALMRAQSDLNKANRDFAGHREKAVDLTKRAIDEVRAAIESDRH